MASLSGLHSPITEKRFNYIKNKIPDSLNYTYYINDIPLKLSRSEFNLVFKCASIYESAYFANYNYPVEKSDVLNSEILSIIREETDEHNSLYKLMMNQGKSDGRFYLEHMNDPHFRGIFPKFGKYAYVFKLVKQDLRKSFRKFGLNNDLMVFQNDDIILDLNKDEVNINTTIPLYEFADSGIRSNSHYIKTTAAFLQLGCKHLGGSECNRECFGCNEFSCNRAVTSIAHTIPTRYVKALPEDAQKLKLVGVHIGEHVVFSCIAPDMTDSTSVIDTRFMRYTDSRNALRDIIKHEPISDFNSIFRAEIANFISEGVIRHSVGNLFTETLSNVDAVSISFDKTDDCSIEFARKSIITMIQEKFRGTNVKVYEVPSGICDINFGDTNPAARNARLLNQMYKSAFYHRKSTNGGNKYV